jgi:ion channel-forming bestrophin family protein
VAHFTFSDPFGYGKNDLNLDHFTHNIIRMELMAITSAPAPDPSIWAFSPENNLIFTGGGEQGPTNGERVSPDEWIRRGMGKIQQALRG